MKKWIFTAILILTVSALAACGSEKGNAEGKASKSIKLGATAGPYSDMLSKAIKPLLEEKGYEIKIVEFSDYIQPNIALDKGDIDANLFQHTVYLKTFNKENHMKLTGLLTVPTAPMGVYSNQYKSLKDIKDGTTIALPNDPVNAARAFNILRDEGLIEIDKNADPLTISEKDVTSNKKKLSFKPLEAGQLPRAVDSVDLSAVPGNYALAAKMDLLSALALENMPDQYRNVVAVKEENKDNQLAKDLVEVVKSEEFEKTIDKDFKGFGKPEWMK